MPRTARHPIQQFSRLATLLVVGVLGMPTSEASAQSKAKQDNWAGIRGITVGPIESSQQPGRGYGTPYSAELLDELKRLGANTISLTPFGRIWSLSSTEIALDFEAPHSANRAAIGEMIRQAHARGIRVILIPHLWVETGGWRGEIEPGSAAGWKKYHRSYRQFLMSWARAAAEFGADAMAIGVECVSWSGRFSNVWSSIIADVRSVFSGPLTYSANWDEVDNVIFWDELDWIGVNAFYPLADHNNATYAEYVAGARAAIAGLTAAARVVGKPAILMEIGYTTRMDAAVEPWLWPDHMKNVQLDEVEQARALAALMGAAAESEDVLGFLLWRYYASLDDVSQEAPWGFSPHGKLAEQVLETVFKARWATDPICLPWERMLFENCPNN